MFKCLGPGWWNCLGGVGRCDLVGGDVSLGVGCEVSKTQVRSHLSCFLLVDQN